MFLFKEVSIENLKQLFKSASIQPQPFSRENQGMVIKKRKPLTYASLHSASVISMEFLMATNDKN